MTKSPQQFSHALLLNRKGSLKTIHNTVPTNAYNNNNNFYGTNNNNNFITTTKITTTSNSNTKRLSLFHKT